MSMWRPDFKPRWVSLLRMLATLGLTNWLNWPTRAPEIGRFLSPQDGISSTISGFSHGVWGSNSAPHGGLASISPAELPFQPHISSAVNKADLLGLYCHAGSCKTASFHVNEKFFCLNINEFPCFGVCFYLKICVLSTHTYFSWWHFQTTWWHFQTRFFFLRCPYPP